LIDILLIIQLKEVCVKCIGSNQAMQKLQDMQKMHN